MRDYLYQADRGCRKRTYRKRRYRDGAWNHHPSLVLRNELLESQNSQKGVAFLRMRHLFGSMLGTSIVYNNLFLPFVLILLIFAVFLSCKFIVFARECFVSFYVNIAIDAVVVRAGVNIVFIV